MSALARRVSVEVYNITKKKEKEKPDIRRD